MSFFWCQVCDRHFHFLLLLAPAVCGSDFKNVLESKLNFQAKLFLVTLKHTMKSSCNKKDFNVCFRVTENSFAWKRQAQNHGYLKSPTLAFCSTFPLLGAMMDRGLFFRVVAELTGEKSLLLMGAEGAGGVTLGWKNRVSTSASGRRKWAFPVGKTVPLYSHMEKKKQVHPMDKRTVHPLWNSAY